MALLMALLAATASSAPLSASPSASLSASPSASPLPALRLPQIFRSDMLLQRNTAYTVWGVAPPGALVRVAVSGSSSGAATAGADGAFEVPMPPERAALSRTLVVSAVGAAATTLRNVAFGDAFFCSGQSNMEYTVAGTFNHSAEVAAASYPGLRLVTVAKEQAKAPANDTALETYGWGVSSPATLQHVKNGSSDPSVFGVPFSATCYYFGRELHKRNRSVPVGLIASSWGGCEIQPWMTPRALQSCGAKPSSGMFNRMMAPLLRLRLVGFVWDQVLLLALLLALLLVLLVLVLALIPRAPGRGEHQRPGAVQLPLPGGDRRLARAVQAAEPAVPVRSDRPELERQADRPLRRPQRCADVAARRCARVLLLPATDPADADSYGLPLRDVRHAQLQALKLPFVAMASAVDLGDPGCKPAVGGCMGRPGDNGRFGGHPRVKQPVGARLAALGAKLVRGYGGGAEPPAATAAPQLTRATLSVGSGGGGGGGGTVRLMFGGAGAAGLRWQNTTMCGLFRYRANDGSGASGSGACCAASAFEVSVDGRPGSWVRSSSVPAASRSGRALPLQLSFTVPAGRWTKMRYAWSDTPMCMLYAAAAGAGLAGQLPVVPFNVTLPYSKLL